MPFGLMRGGVTMGTKFLRACFLALISCTLMAAPPKRVVSHAIGTDDLLLALADRGQIAALSHVARSAYAYNAAEARRFPILKNSTAESILAVKPDLVLLTSFSAPETVAVLKKSGVRLYMVEKYETLDDVYATLSELGDMLGQVQRAEAVIASCRARISALAEALKGVKPARVISAGEYSLISGSNTTFQELCDHAGAINVAAEAGIDGVAPIPSEKVLSWKIDYLVGWQDPGSKMVDRLKGVAPYRFLDVYKQGKLVEIPGALFMATSHHRIAAFEMLAKALHPERFK
jgi:iron complex transport system substrate-binding protein